MRENDANNSPSQNNDKNNSSAEYLRRAEVALSGGDTTLSLHLYLAAFELSSQNSLYPSDAAVKGLRQAWKLACAIKERSLAEHIFEKLEPYLSPDEMSVYAEQLQQLALDKLEEFGIDTQDLEDVTQMISQDFFGFDQITNMIRPDSKLSAIIPSKTSSRDKTSGFGLRQTPANERSTKLEKAAPGNDDDQAFADRPNYDDIVGYDNAIDLMKRYGIGIKKDVAFEDLVKELNAFHGLEKMPIADTFVFQSPVREDANHFMMATLGEIDLPAIRMRVEENLQGMPVLSVMAQTSEQTRLDTMRHAFEGGGVLVLENIDQWGIPLSDNAFEGFEGFMPMQFSRGAREAISLIRYAIENPEVYVLASLSSEWDLDLFFDDLLGPTTRIDVKYPTEKERSDIWNYLVKRHPSLRQIDRPSLIKLSARLSRFDICMAAREVVEDAYRKSLADRQYRPVASEALFEKLAAYQPLESKEYQQLEDAVLDDFRKSLDDLDELLKGPGETE